MGPRDRKDTINIPKTSEEIRIKNEAHILPDIPEIARKFQQKNVRQIPYIFLPGEAFDPDLGAGSGGSTRFDGAANFITKLAKSNSQISQYGPSEFQQKTEDLSAQSCWWKKGYRFAFACSSCISLKIHS